MKAYFASSEYKSMVKEHTRLRFQERKSRIMIDWEEFKRANPNTKEVIAHARTKSQRSDTKSSQTSQKSNNNNNNNYDNNNNNNNNDMLGRSENERSKDIEYHDTNVFEQYAPDEMDDSVRSVSSNSSNSSVIRHNVGDILQLQAQAHGHINEQQMRDSTLSSDNTRIHRSNSQTSDHAVYMAAYQQNKSHGNNPTDADANTSTDKIPHLIDNSEQEKLDQSQIEEYDDDSYGIQQDVDIHYPSEIPETSPLQILTEINKKTSLRERIKDGKN
ncbi:MAG: hypothetical protein EZS28_015361 [Streblomastix strix]|uniref:Uncharacterized protein n=1 Tax=Streblomastix strix TaxID=222440 RepID=A0A5J4W3N1_9EUKA|nr:MAG: hypothetical protein EZS28_015361 [Streblomastix strix]